MPRKIVFVARDGGLLERSEPEGRGGMSRGTVARGTVAPGAVDHGAMAFDALRLDAIGLAPCVIPALLRLAGAGYELVVIGDGTPSPVDAFVERLLCSQGLRLAASVRCTHGSAAGCDCRPPGLGLVREYLAADVLDRAASAVVADSGAWLALAANMGLAGFLLRGVPAPGQGPGQGPGPGPRSEPGRKTRSDTTPQAVPTAMSWPNVAHALLDRPRTAHVHRKTRETDIEIRVDLDREADARAATGIGFFDHMLEQLGKHGGFALEITCRGDLEIDEHHTVEDVALALGQALRQALGDKRGIGRYGFLLPMDEADAEIAVDLGGRPYLVFEGQFARERVGELPTELVPHFFRSLAETLGAAVHIRVRGENTHHMVEAAFKGVARTLRQAFARQGEALPTTKGLL